MIGQFTNRRAALRIGGTSLLGLTFPQMLAAANNLEFEKAALLRDQLRELKRNLSGSTTAAATDQKSSLVSYGKEKLASRGRGRAKSRVR